jgi:predicted O-methyltransferase YrrM
MSEPAPIAGQLNDAERALLTDALTHAAKKPEVVLEVGTWLGGGSTLHILRALEKNGTGHLWGVEADRSIYERMIANIRAAAPEASARFTPLFGFSQEVIPKWSQERGPGLRVDFAFLDGGNNPQEQIDEFHLLDPLIPVGGQLMAHDAKLRKGKWLVPYLRALDHWKTQLHDVSTEGLFAAVKVAEQPSPASRKAARRVLRRLRWSLAEVVGKCLPARVNEFLLTLMPTRLRKRVAEGR